MYVGRDSNIHIDERHKDHFYPSRYDEQVINRVLQNNPDRYSYQRLWEIEDCTDNHLNEMEKYYTKIYNPKFSFTEGGGGTSGYKWTDEQKRKKSESVKGENNPMYGNHHSEESKKKISEKKKDKKHPEETKRKISKTKSKQQNTTGFYRVSMQNCSLCKKGFRWCYRYHVNSKRKCISSVDLNKLKEKVLDQGLEWEIIDEENAIKSLEKDKEGVK